VAHELESKSHIRRVALLEPSDVKQISRREGSELLDRQARKYQYLGMSGEEFKRQYRAGTIEDSERSEVIRVSMLIPLAED
jgi:hypothetical protein